MKLLGTLMAALGVAMFGGAGSFADQDNGNGQKAGWHHWKHHKHHRYHKHRHHTHKSNQS